MVVMIKQPNFFELSQKYPALKECVDAYAARSSRPSCILDWNDQKTLRTLTTVILKDEFDINIDLPSDRLCPPVTNRLTYVTWIAQILDLSQCSQLDEQNLQLFYKANDEYCDAPAVHLATGASVVPTVAADNSRSSYSKDSIDAALTLEVRESKYERSINDCHTLNPRLEAFDVMKCSNGDTATKNHHILDIGVGASCIYPLLGHRNYKWR